MKFAWVMAEGNVWDNKKQFITTALESGMDHIVDFTDVDNIKKLGNVKIISDTEGSDIVMVVRNSEGDGTLKVPDDLSESKDLSAVKRLKRMNKKVSAYVEITSKKHEQLARILGKRCRFTHSNGRDCKVIPLENIIADLQKENVRSLLQSHKP